MGYESKIFIGWLHEADPGAERGECWFYDVAMIELGKAHDSQEDFHRCVERWRKKLPEEKIPVIFEGPGGETAVICDSYGEKLIPIPIRVALKALRADAKKVPGSRHEWAVAVINQILKGGSERNPKLSVLHFRH